MIGLPVLQISAQSNLSWEVLADVTFEEEKLDDLGTYWLAPTFGEVIELFENQEVSIEGYLILIDLEDNFNVLSKYPYSSCFFCGGAGPESVVELHFKEEIKGVKLDQRVRIQGILELNKSDIEHLNYIVKNAQIIDQ
jgi:hypothetical protein